MAIDDGGPAFPGEQGHTPDGTWNQTYERGMSKRDVFTAEAVDTASFLLVNLNGSATASMVAECAVGIADALIAELKKGAE